MEGVPSSFSAQKRSPKHFLPSFLPSLPLPCTAVLHSPTQAQEVHLHRIACWHFGEIGGAAFLQPCQFLRKFHITVLGGKLVKRCCKIFSESSPYLLGQHSRCSTAQRPVELSETFYKTFLTTRRSRLYKFEISCTRFHNRRALTL